MLSLVEREREPVLDEFQKPLAQEAYSYLVDEGYDVPGIYICEIITAYCFIAEEYEELIRFIDRHWTIRVGCRNVAAYLWPRVQDARELVGGA